MNTQAINFPKDGLWDVRQASHWLSISELSVRTMLKRRQFPAAVVVKIGRRVRFRSDLLRQCVLKQQSA
jgi:predicted DNA-binding transcriptional regulator AlpA